MPVKKVSFLGLAIIFFAIAVASFLLPSFARLFGARWGWFFGRIWDYFGAMGISIFWMLVFMVFLAFFLGTGTKAKTRTKAHARASVRTHDKTRARVPSKR